MKLRDLFKAKKKQETSALSRILDRNEILPLNHPNLIYIAVGVVSEYDEMLEEASGLPNVSEETLPYPKKDIQKAIELLLNYLKNENKSWESLRKKYPDIAESMITDDFYKALRVGYIDLARFISKEDANLCLRAAIFLNEPENKCRTTEENALAIKNNYLLNNALKVSEGIKEDKFQCFQYLQNNYGEKDVIFLS
jgi:hypothetical protein